jgi:hypothetical protein
VTRLVDGCGVRSALAKRWLRVNGGVGGGTKLQQLALPLLAGYTDLVHTGEVFTAS